eukprot:1129225-Prymnesium_polylepis.1
MATPRPKMATPKMATPRPKMATPRPKMATPKMATPKMATPNMATSTMTGLATHLPAVAVEGVVPREQLSQRREQPRLEPSRGRLAHGQQ